VQADAGGSPGLNFHELSAIPLKGYSEPVPVYIVGIAVELGEDCQERLVHALFEGTSNTSKVTFALPDGPILKEPQADVNPSEAEEDSGDEFVVGEVASQPLDGEKTDADGAEDNAKAWREVHRISETSLTYAQYCTLLPAYFGTQEVQQEVSDYIWIRSSGGNPSRVAELVRHYKEIDIGKAETPMGCWVLTNPGFPSLVEIASAVPGRLASRLLTGVAELSPLNQLVFKVIAVLGGSGTTKLVRHLLHRVPFLHAQWKELCTAFQKHYHEYHGVNVSQRRYSRMSLLQGQHRGSSLQHKPATPDKPHEEVDVLVAVLADLEDHALIEMDGGAEEVTCNDFLLIDTLYSNLTFSHRKAIHEATAKFLRSCHSEVEGVISLLPNIIHHTMLSQQESKAAGLVGVAKNFSTNDFLGHFIVRQVQWHLPLAESSEGDEVAIMQLRAEQTLPAIPSLRGLAKAMHQQLVGATVTQAVKCFSKTLGRRSEQ